MSVSLAWSFDTTVALGSGASPPPWRWRALARVGGSAVRPCLGALVVVYLTLAGFTCARWCDLLARAVAPMGSVAAGAHAHHHHPDHPTDDTRLPAAAALAPDATPLAWDTCRWQNLHPLGLLVPLLREMPLPGVAFGALLALVVVALAPGPPLAPPSRHLRPVLTPPRAA